MTPIPDPLPGRPLHIVVMGVSGNGKSTLGGRLEERLGWPFAEGDEFHPKANVEKMQSGTPLTDDDRWPWLRELRDWIAEHDRAGQSTLMACSALKRPYRDVLREGAEGVYFIHLVADKALLLERMEGRDHFMPSSLLDSQLDTLEPLGDDERGVAVGIDGTPEQTLQAALGQLGMG